MQTKNLETAEEGENVLGEDSSTLVAQIFLLAIPLFCAPVAFYFNSKQASTYSLGLEFMFIGILIIEFGILVLLKSELFKIKGIYSDTRPSDRFEVRLVCEKCGNKFRHSIFHHPPRMVECSSCDNHGAIRVNDSYDGIVHTETPPP